MERQLARTQRSAALELELRLLASRQALDILAKAKQDQRSHQDREQQIMMGQAEGGDRRRQRDRRGEGRQRHDSADCNHYCENAASGNTIAIGEITSQIPSAAAIPLPP